MKVELKKSDEAFHFLAKGSSGVELKLDTSPEFGGGNKGARPMELVLMALGYCSAIDIIKILEKQKVKVEDFDIVVNGDRDPDNIPSLFTNIHIHYILKGSLDSKKVQRAVDLSVNKYCSVAAILRHTAEISYEFSIKNE